MNRFDCRIEKVVAEQAGPEAQGPRRPAHLQDRRSRGRHQRPHGSGGPLQGSRHRLPREERLRAAGHGGQRGPVGHARPQLPQGGRPVQADGPRRGHAVLGRDRRPSCPRFASSRTAMFAAWSRWCCRTAIRSSASDTSCRARARRSRSRLRVHWNEKDRMLKLSVPVRGTGFEYLGQTAFGVNPLPTHGNEAVAQKWVAVVSRRARHRPDLHQRRLVRLRFLQGRAAADAAALAGVLGASVLRSADRRTGPLHAAHRPGRTDLPLLVQCRAGQTSGWRRSTARPWSTTRNPSPCRSTRRAREPSRRPARCSATTWCRSAASSWPRTTTTSSSDSSSRPARARSTTLSLPFIGAKTKVDLGPFEVKTFRVNPKTRKVQETDLIERPMKG